MNNALRITLDTPPDAVRRLKALQQAFAAVCNALAPLVQQTRCWNRVGLHHLAYKRMREQFPGLGSQMICNAIYSVSRAARIVYQHPKSPHNIARHRERPLPRLQFTPAAAVYFDRHTLSIRDGQISLLTLDGRMRFHADLPPEHEHRFRTAKLREIALTSQQDTFFLTFRFSDDTQPEDATQTMELPEYVLVTDASAPDTTAPAPDSAQEAQAQP